MAATAWRAPDAGWVFLVFAVLILVAVAALVHRFADTAARRRAVKETFALLEATDWSPTVQGDVGKPGVLDASAKESVKREIDAWLRGAQRCTRAGVDLPLEWRPVGAADQRTCAVEITNPVVRNSCGEGNDLLYDDRVVERAYIDPDSYRCFVRFRENARSEDMERYVARVDVGATLRRIFSLQRRVEELEDEIARLENEISDVREKIAKQERQISGLRDQRATLQNEEARLESEIAQVQREVKSLRREVDRLQATLKWQANAQLSTQRRVTNFFKEITQSQAFTLDAPSEYVVLVVGAGGGGEWGIDRAGAGAGGGGGEIVTRTLRLPAGEYEVEIGTGSNRSDGGATVLRSQDGNTTITAAGGRAGSRGGSGGEAGGGGSGAGGSANGGNGEDGREVVVNGKKYVVGGGGGGGGGAGAYYRLGSGNEREGGRGGKGGGGKGGDFNRALNHPARRGENGEDGTGGGGGGGGHGNGWEGRSRGGSGLVVIASASPSSSATPLVTVYKHCGYRGRNRAIYAPGKYNMDWVKEAVGNDQMSAVRVAPGYEVELFRHVDFRGTTIKTRSDIDCFIGHGRWRMNDTVSSLIVRRV